MLSRLDWSRNMAAILRSRLAVFHAEQGIAARLSGRLIGRTMSELFNQPFDTGTSVPHLSAARQRNRMDLISGLFLHRLVMIEEPL